MTYSSPETEKDAAIISVQIPELQGCDPATWLVTGAAGFIGSNLVEVLLRADQKVVGLDNFATGHRRNLEELERILPANQWANFRMIEGDIRNRETCASCLEGVDYVLHQAALGSVPRSIDDPLTSHDANVSGFINMLDAARQANVKRFIYAASSSTYGDSPELPKREERIGQPLSPYAVTKLVNELYAAVYARAYGFKATRPSLLQRLRAAARPERRLRGRHPQMGRRNDR